MPHDAEQGKAAPQRKCTNCGVVVQIAFMCDREPGLWCGPCFAQTPCGREEHGEGCETKVFYDEAAAPPADLRQKCTCHSPSATVPAEALVAEWGHETSCPLNSENKTAGQAAPPLLCECGCPPAHHGSEKPPDTPGCENTKCRGKCKRSWESFARPITLSTTTTFRAAAERPADDPPRREIVVDIKPRKPGEAGKLLRNAPKVVMDAEQANDPDEDISDTSFGLPESDGGSREESNREPRTPEKGQMQESGDNPAGADSGVEDKK